MIQAPPRARWRMWYGLAVLTTVSAFAQMDRIALAILLQPIKLELHLSDQQLGLLTGLAFALFYATLGLPLARYADRASRTKLLAICLGLWTLMTTLSGFTRTFPQLFLARVGVGVGEAGCTPAAFSLIGDLFPRTRRTLAVAIFQCGGAVGISVGTFLIGMMGHYLGWRACLQLIGLAGLPIALLVFFTVPEPPRPTPVAESGESARQALGALARRPAFVHLALANGLAAVSNTGIGQWSAAYLMRSFDLSMAQVGVWAGLAIAAGSILGLLSAGVVATWLSRRDRRWELWIPAGAIAVSFPITLMMALSPTAVMALSCNIALAVSSSVAAVAAMAAVQSFAEPHRRATAVSLVIFLYSVLGLGLGPYVIGLASDLLTPTFGRESLRYGMLVASLFLPWASIHYMIAARRSPLDVVD
jgi:MFS family permease